MLSIHTQVTTTKNNTQYSPLVWRQLTCVWFLNATNKESYAQDCYSFLKRHFQRVMMILAVLGCTVYVVLQCGRSKHVTLFWNDDSCCCCWLQFCCFKPTQLGQSSINDCSMYKALRISHPSNIVMPVYSAFEMWGSLIFTLNCDVTKRRHMLPAHIHTHTAVALSSPDNEHYTLKPHLHWLSPRTRASVCFFSLFNLFKFVSLDRLHWFASEFAVSCKWLYRQQWVLKHDKNVFSKNCRCSQWNVGSQNYLRELLQHFANDFSLGEFSPNSRRALALDVDGFRRNQCIIMQQELARDLGEISPSVCSFGVDAPLIKIEPLYCSQGRTADMVKTVL